MKTKRKKTNLTLKTTAMEIPALVRSNKNDQISGKSKKNKNLENDRATCSMPISYRDIVRQHLNEKISFVRVKMSSKDHRRMDLTGFGIVLNGQLASTERIKTESERYILSKLRYKLTGPYSRHKFWRSARRLSQLLIQLPMHKCTNTLRRLVDGIQIQQNDTLYCPSQQYFIYAMSSVIEVSVKLTEIIFECVNCGKQCMAQLKLEQLAAVTLVLLAVAASIHKWAIRMLTNLCSIYETFTTWRSKLNLHTSLPNNLTSDLPIIGNVLSTRNRNRTNQLQQEYTDFISRMLKMSSSELMMENSSRGEMKKSSTFTSSDVGVSVSRAFYEKMEKSKLRGDVEKIETIMDVKKLYIKYKGSSFKNGALTRLIRKRWSSLFSLHKLKAQIRLKTDIAHLRAELLVLFPD